MEAETNRIYFEAKGEVLSEISQKRAIKEAKQLASATQEEYIMAEKKARVEEEMVRKVNQRKADHAMEVSHYPSPTSLSLCHSPAAAEREGGESGRNENKSTSFLEERDNPPLTVLLSFSRKNATLIECMN